MKTLEDLFEHQIKDLYSAEDQLVKALPKMAQKAKTEKLKNAIEKHLEQTKEHRNRIEKICDELDIKPQGEKCLAMKGLLEEAEHFMKEDMDDDVLDAGIIAEAQRIEHYEISAYGTATRFAKELGHGDIASTLHSTLTEEYEADENLTEIAESRVNEKAKSNAD